MRSFFRPPINLQVPFTARRLYQYPNGNVEDVMRMLQRVSQRRKHKLRWCMDTENVFGIEVFDHSTQRWLTPTTVFTGDAPISEEAIDRQVEAMITSKRSSQRPQSHHTKHQPTVIDFAKQPDLVQIAKEQLRTQFPHLQLQLVHTAGTDLQSRQTHTISVSLFQRGDTITSAEKKALEQFEAEAIGPGFMRTARRALEEAFDKCGLSFATSTAERSRSVLGSYAELLESGSRSLSVSATQKSENAVLQVMLDSELCSSVTCEGPAKLEKLLEALKQAADLQYPEAAQQLRASVEAHPLILVLPKERIRVKRMLRELLHYYYGLTEEDIYFTTNHNVQGVFASSIETILPLVQPGPHGGRQRVTLARASGVSKSAAEQLAAVLALQAHFPKEYVEQISFHHEVADILQSTKASAHHDFPPPASKGLKNLLDWALNRSNVNVKLTPLLLQAYKKYENFGVQPTVNIWCTTIDVRVGEDSKTLMVYDQKKNRCENKAVALILFSYFSDLCPEGIAFAKEKGFLSESGTSPPCPALTPLERCDQVTAEDKLLSSLQVVPWQTLERTGDESVCLLERLRSASKAISKDLKLAPPSLDERVLYDTVKDVFVASLVTQKKDKEEVVCSFAHQNELRCLLSLYTSFAKGRDELAKELVYDVPYELPMRTPLETTAVLVHRLYGLQVAVRLTMTNSIYCVELWGLAKEEDDGAKRWILAKMKGTSFQNAVRSCCAEFFETHVRHLHPPFGGTLCNSAESTLTILPQSALATLIGHVQKEIQQTSTEKNLSLVVKLAANRALSIPLTIRMVAVSELHTIVLEKCTGSKLLVLLHELRKNIAVETEEQSLKKTSPPSSTAASAASGARNVSVVDRLKEKLEALYGLTLVVETLLYDKMWVSRLSVQLNETHSYALCVSQSDNKKQSVENACMNVLTLYFEEPLHNLFSSDAAVHECNYLYSHTK